MSRLLIVSDTPVMRTGQARVVRELVKKFLADYYDVHVAGWFHDVAMRAEPCAAPIHAVDKNDPRTLARVIDMVKPEIILAIGDPWDFEALARLRARVGGFKLVGYLNIEASPIPPSCEVILDAFDVLTTTSRYGAGVIGRPGVMAIHHGVDREVFSPQEKPATELLGFDLRKTFVVLLNGQNTARKNFAAAIAGFAHFAQGKDNVLCYVNSKSTPGSQDAPGQDLAEVVRQYQLGRKVVFNTDNRGPLDCVTDGNVNWLYGMADVLLVTSVAEGFCLPILEAMATKTIPVVPDAYSARELLKDSDDGPDRGVLIPVAATFRGDRGTEVAIVDPKDVAVRLRMVYEAWEEGRLDEMQRTGMAFAMSRGWDRTYGLLRDAMALPLTKVADGREIDTGVRAMGRALAREHPGAIAVLKLGGLGDMLQTTVVVRAAAAKYGAPVVVFGNAHLEVFDDMPEVVAVAQVPDTLQDILVRSLADQFRIFMDVRYVSRAYGEPPTEFFTKHEWFYRNWNSSNARLASLGHHTTWLMLMSLGLADVPDPLCRPEPPPRPIYESRDVVPGDPEPGYICVASGAGTFGKLKQYPMSEWEPLIEHLEGRGYRLVQIGGAEDPPLPGTMDCRDLPLDRTAAILERAICLIAPEGGMVHLAKATDTKAVVLFGPTDVVLFGYEGGNAGLLNPGNVNLRPEDGDGCPPCWFVTPGWGQQHCTMGEPSCVNFPSWGTVAHYTERLVTNPVVVAHWEEKLAASSMETAR